MKGVDGGSSPSCRANVGAVWLTFRAISLVAAPCCSTAEAMDVAILLTSSIVSLTPRMASTASRVAAWIWPIWAPISSVAFAVWLARFFTSDLKIYLLAAAPIQTSRYSPMISAAVGTRGLFAGLPDASACSAISAILPVHAASSIP